MSPRAQAQSATPSQPSPESSGQEKSAEPTPQRLFSGLSGEQLRRAWNGGMLLAALSLAQREAGLEKLRQRKAQREKLVPWEERELELG
jgi:hypothetical protein